MRKIVRYVLPASLLYISGMLIMPGCNRMPAADKSASKPAVQQAAAATLPPSDTATPAKEPVENVTSFDHLNSILEGSPGKLLVFDMYADWCKPCRLLAPTYHELAKTYKNHVRFYRVDVQQHQDIASAFQVNGIPNVVFIKDKEVVQSITGLNPRESYERVLTVCGPSVPAAECKSMLADGL